MFKSIATYHVHHHHPLPANDSLAYQYILAANGLFIRAETHLFEAILLVAPCTVRGLIPLSPHFRLKVPRIPARLLESILTDACRARRSDGGLNEVLYQFHHHGRTVQVKKPPQQATSTSVKTAVGHTPAVLCDLHSHGNMRAFWSSTDDADEQGARLYAVIGKLDSEPELRLRVGVYGYWRPLPVTAVFTSSGPFQDLYSKEKYHDHESRSQ
jgi:PRTRC genetic system protein A